jgi:hypothetical protein
MTSSCDIAIVSNFNTQILNMDSQISYIMKELGHMENLGVARNGKAGKVAEITARNIEHYQSGHYITQSYPSKIKLSALQAVGIQNHNDIIYWKNNLVLPNHDKTTCPAGGPHLCCYSLANQDPMCCSCRGNSTCNSSFWCGGINPPHCNSNASALGQCNIRLTTNLFKSTMDADIAAEIAVVDGNIADLAETLRSFRTKSPNIFNMANIECCQNIILGNIEAGKVTFNEISQTCTTKETPVV